MGLSDREYSRRHRLESEFQGPPPPKPKLWILIVALVMVAIFFLLVWPRR